MKESGIAMMGRVMMTLALATLLAYGAQAGELRVYHADFSGANPPDRVSEDIPMSVDLIRASAIAFDFRCEDLQAFSGFSLYFKSGKGWYSVGFTPRLEGRTEHMIIPVSEITGVEGSPSGKDKISHVRFSAWNGAPVRSEVAFGNFRTLTKEEWEAPPKLDRRQMDEKMQADAKRLAVRIGKSGERRMMWCHSPVGLGKGQNWESSVETLKGLGFTDLIVNLCWGGISYYNSKVLTRTADEAEAGDLLAQCQAACRRQGIRLHVWRVCWSLGGSRTAPADVARCRAEGRLIEFAPGEKPEIWFCPSNPTNQLQEVKAMCELADKGVDGVHFDYIRYPGHKCCICAGCRSRFEKRIGHPVERWPEDVLGGVLQGEWTDFRSDNISRVVRAVASRVRAKHPKVELSAAVLRNSPLDRRSCGQDWAKWCQEGWLDFVCPMDYTESPVLFNGHLARQKGFVAGVKMFPGIGLSCWQEDGGDIERLAEQIGLVRKEGLPGFTVFNFDVRCRRALDLMRKAERRK